jgi:hypothetical protein
LALHKTKLTRPKGLEGNAQDKSVIEELCAETRPALSHTGQKVEGGACATRSFERRGIVVSSASLAASKGLALINKINSIEEPLH